METLDQLHREHLELQSNIQFYTKETQFLLHLISKEAKRSTSNHDLKLLNAYSEVFEGFKSKLTLLHKEVTIHEKNFSSVYNGYKEELQQNNLTEMEIDLEYCTLIEDYKITKESLYAFLTHLHHSTNNEHNLLQ